MATYVLIHGASSDSWYWHRVVPELAARGHDVVAPDLPCDDDAAGLSEYTDAVVQAIGDRRDVIVVAQSLGGFTAPLVSERVPVTLMVLVAAMVPAPGELLGEWWANTGYFEAQADRDGELDVLRDFFHDVPEDVTAAAFARGERGQSDTPLQEHFPLDAWPDVPTRFVLAAKDRFFPADFLRRMVKDRLGITPDEIDTGHLPALADPQALVEMLETYRKEQGL